MNNPYAAPNADIDHDAIADTRLFSIDGRIGRVRWIGYLAVMWILSLVVSVGFAGVMEGRAAAAMWIGSFYLGSSLTVFLLVSRRRLQDLGRGPLFLVLALIPVVNLYFLFMMVCKRGDDARNQYGPVPLPNDRAAYWLAAIVPVVIVGTIADRAYVHYEHARMRAEITHPAWESYYPK